MSRRTTRQTRAGSNRNAPAKSPRDNGTTTAHALGLHHIAIAALIIALLTTVAYISSFRGVFLFDDIRHIVANADLLAPDAIARALSTDRPLVALTFVMNVRLAATPPGEALSPVGFHAVNLLIHITAALALLGVIRRTLLLPIFQDRFHRHALPLAFAIAAIWAVHPLQTQSVTYIVQRGESLMGLCYLLTLYCYIRGATAECNKHIWYIASIVVCAAGMASKGVMVTAPLLIALYDRCLLTQSWLSTLRRRWPVLLGLFLTLILLVVIDVAPGILTTGAKRASVGFSYQNAAVEGPTWLHYFFTQPLVILHYLRLSIWPNPLILDYYWPFEQSFANALPSLIAISVMGLATLWLLWKKPPLGFVAAAFFIILAPTSSIIPIKDAIFEHRMYLSLAAVVSLIVIGIYTLLQRWWRNANLSITARKLSVSLPMIVVLTSLAAATYARNLDYQSAERMWRDALTKQPGHLRAMNNLAAELISRADTINNPQQAADLRNEACNYFREIFEHDMTRVDLPIYAVQYGLANCLVNEGDVEAALPLFEAAVTIQPRFLKAHIQYGNALSKLDRHAEAAERFRAAAEAGKLDKPGERPLIALAHHNRGNELFRLKQYNAAIEAYETAASISSQYAKSWYMAGQCWEILQDPDRARQAYQTLLKYIPNHNDARQRLNVLDQN